MFLTARKIQYNLLTEKEKLGSIGNEKEGEGRDEASA
jgi:hypothetical protein